jgi:hypothetical protein
MLDKKKVFISYSHKDSAVAETIYNGLRKHGLEVWLDVIALVAGQPLASQIESGLRGSDYYILLISENSNSSAWVKREIALAISLADKNKISVLPILLDDAPVPFEFQGLFYIKAIGDNAALDNLLHYFRLEDTSSRDLSGGGVVIRKSIDDKVAMLTRCQLLLSELKTRDLRHHITTRLTLEDVKVVWFDLFETRMSDDLQIFNLALSCVELIARSDREGVRQTLLELLCRNHPRIAQTIK